MLLETCIKALNMLGSGGKSMCSFPVPLAIEMTGQARQIGRLGKRTKGIAFFAFQWGRTTLYNLSKHVSSKIISWPSVSKTETPYIDWAQLEGVQPEMLVVAWSLVWSTASTGVLLVLCVLYCWIGRERCVMRRHYYICRLKCSQALIFCVCP